MHVFMDQASVITFIREMPGFKILPSNLRKHMEVAKLLFLKKKKIYFSYKIHILLSFLFSHVLNR